MKPIRYLDVCAGISASTVAWQPLGWEAAAYSEIEAAPRAILAHHYPDTPLHGDFTTIRGDEYGPVDLLVGGTPCQSFSIAGLRGGLADDRGNLALEFLRLAGRTRPRWVVWENVPGVFSALSHSAPDPCPPDIDLDAGDGPGDGEEIVVEDSYDADESHAFACFLAGLHELGYGAAYRVLDAQYAGVPQRRRRVFVVGYLGDWRRAAAVLFERHSLSGHPAPRREAGKVVASSLTASTGGVSHKDGIDGRLAYGGGNTSGPVPVATALTAHGRRLDFEVETFIAEQTGTLAAGGNTTGGNRYPGMSADTADTMLIAHALRGEGFDASEDGTGRGTPLVPVPFDTTQITSPTCRSNPRVGDPCHPLAASAHPPAIAFNSREDPCSSEDVFGALGSTHPQAQAVAFDMRGRDGGSQFEGPHDTANLRAASGGSSRSYVAGADVRRLTPRECERLQGFEDDYTLVPYRGRMMADGPRYKALGNSMAVPVMRWIGERIAAVEALSAERLAA